jgi:hypothetical protein
MATITDVIQRCDIGTTDAHTAGDTGSGYTGKVRGRPHFLAGLFNRHGIQDASVLALAGSRFVTKLTRDFGLETISVTCNATATASETHVILFLDNLSIAEAFALQVEFADDPNNIQAWRLFAFVANMEKEQTA